MRQRKTFQLLGLVIAILVMTVGYAAIQDVNLVIEGNIKATPDQANFNVRFTGTPTYSGTGYASLTITGNTTATMNVSGLQDVGDYVTAVFTVANSSTDLTAYLSCTTNLTVSDNGTYFKVTTTLGTTELEAQTTTTLQVKVQLLKVVSSEITGNLEIVLTASPLNNSGSTTNTVSNSTVSNSTVSNNTVSNNTVSNNTVSNNTVSNNTTY